MSVLSDIDLPTFESLKESMGSDFIDELVQAYFDETPQLIASLKDALARKDHAAFRQAAHSIKSTSNSFGALQFGELARELEMMGRQADLNGAEPKVESLVNGYILVQKQLEALCHD